MVGMVARGDAAAAEAVGMRRLYGDARFIGLHRRFFRVARCVLALCGEYRRWQQAQRQRQRQQDRK